MAASRVDRWLYPTDNGLYCEPGGFYIDPSRAIERAVITHGHSDHARPGHGAVLATPETIEIMKVRMGPGSAGTFDAMAYGDERCVDGVSIRLLPAGHILGSAQVVIEYKGCRAVISGDYKRSADPTCLPFEVVPCDTFVTEATFALPVFRHEPAEREVTRLLQSVARSPERAHLIGVYGLGKCQRVIKLARLAGYDDAIFLHGALQELCALYGRLGISLGDLRPVGAEPPSAFAGRLVMCPPSSLGDRWSQRFPDPVTAFASGWMRIKGRVRQSGVELPLVISDHADWPELLDTIVKTGAEDVWVTHGREDALVYQLGKMGVRARALALAGFEEEGE
ncbi:MAG: ligase-associated DNA damage response exonuclease [Hyphomicrobium sp.]|jgi:putative mRNA 3-end processing factor